MGGGRGRQEARERLFDSYSRNLSFYLPQLHNQFLCPVCFRLFGRESLEARTVTIEHVPPQSVGGGVLTLTCRDCNSAAGSRLESHLPRRFHREDFIAGVSEKALKGRLSIGEGEMGADFYRYPDRLEIHGIPDISDPERHAALVRELESGHMEGSFTLGSPYDGLASWVAALRMGYLLMFRQFGYRYVLHHNVQQVRHQILNPNDHLIAARAVVRLAQRPPVINSVGLLYRPRNLRCFFATVDLSTALDRYLGVVLPGLDEPSASIYERWQEAAPGTIDSIDLSIVWMAWDRESLGHPRGLGLAPFWIWENMGKTLETWAGRSDFSYHGSVPTGTEILYGRRPYRAWVAPSQYNDLLRHFRCRTAKTGTSRQPAPGSVGAWLQQHVTRTAIASYVGPILIAEGYAQRVAGDPSLVRFIRDRL